MPINISIPQNIDVALYQMLVDAMRRSVDGSVALPDGKGLILSSPNGTKYRLGVDNDGALTTTAI